MPRPYMRPGVPLGPAQLGVPLGGPGGPPPGPPGPPPGGPPGPAAPPPGAPMGAPGPPMPDPRQLQREAIIAALGGPSIVPGTDVREPDGPSTEPRSWWPQDATRRGQRY